MSCATPASSACAATRRRRRWSPKCRSRLPAPAADDVKISNPDRVIFPEAKVTKGELADYYRAVGALMAVWTANRPISLVRCPQGRAKKCFFQKHDSGTFGPHVHHVPIREKDGHKEDYLYVEDAAGVLACVQMGTIEFHGWGSKVADVEKPDRIVFDLDPDDRPRFRRGEEGGDATSSAISPTWACRPSRC